VRIAFFTAGTVGAGHLVHGLAIARALERAGFSATYRMFGPRQPFTAAERDDWTIVAVEEAELASRERAAASELATRLADFAPDVLIVDMFWAPLRFVLPLRGCEAWLLLRSFPPTWLSGPPGVPFDRMQYARIIAMEPVSADCITHRIDPIVIVNPDEVEPPGAFRRRLGVKSGRLVAVAHAGLRGEITELTPASQAGETVVSLDMFDRDALFPVARWLGDCDALHLGVGYNAYWEARWLGYADRTAFTPFPRRNDDQRWRLTSCRDYAMRANGADVLVRWAS
jgi:hypothetical protein